jgi:hypothetical protein
VADEGEEDERRMGRQTGLATAWEGHGAVSPSRAWCLLRFGPALSCQHALPADTARCIRAWPSASHAACSCTRHAARVCRAAALRRLPAPSAGPSSPSVPRAGRPAARCAGPARAAHGAVIPPARMRAPGHGVAVGQWSRPEGTRRGASDGPGRAGPVLQLLAWQACTAWLTSPYSYRMTGRRNRRLSWQQSTCSVVVAVTPPPSRVRPGRTGEAIVWADEGLLRCRRVQSLTRRHAPVQPAQVRRASAGCAADQLPPERGA